MVWFGSSNSADTSASSSPSSEFAPNLTTPETSSPGLTVSSSTQPISSESVTTKFSKDDGSVNAMLAKSLGEDSMIVKVLDSNPYFAAVCIFFF